MNLRSIRVREVFPWALLGVVLSCGGAAIAPATPPTPPAGPVASIDTQEVVLRGKDGQVRGRLTGEGLTLSDAAGNRIAIALDGGARIALTSGTGAFGVTVVADGQSASVATVGQVAQASLAIDGGAAEMNVSAGGRKLVGAAEAERPLADLEVFDAADKRRASFGLNSNGEPRLSLYDAAETRRIYAILSEGVPLLDLNDAGGAAAVELFGADPRRGSGLVVSQIGRTAATGLGVDGKPLR